jgi:hypothetical protein
LLPWVAGRVVGAAAIAALAAGSLSACAPLAPTGTATISGTISVPHDIERTDDTVVDVSLHLPGEEDMFVYTLAEPDGAYTITGVPPGDYTMYVSVFDADIAPQWWGGSTTAQDADIFRVEAGEARTDMDVSLVKGATLSGAISVPRGSKATLKHTWVTVWDARERAWKGDSAVSAHGHYAVRGLAAGEYKIEVTPGRGELARQWAGGASDWTAARTFAVDASTERAGLDVALIIGGAISGSVSGTAAKEYGASVYATLRAADGAWEDGSWAEVDADGTYTIRGLAPGSYAVMFSRPTGDRPWDVADAAVVRASSEVEPSNSKYWADKPDVESADLVVVDEGATVTDISADLDAPPPSAN